MFRGYRVRPCGCAGSLFEKDKSVAENINALCFNKGGELRDEFDKLYKSLFKKADNHIAIINALSTVGKGMTRGDIIAKTKLSNNGNLTTLLNELEQCEFIRSFVPFKKEKKDMLIRIENEMREAAKNMDFERAMELRDIIFEMKVN